jgi:hypothetical protein
MSMFSEEDHHSWLMESDGKTHRKPSVDQINVSIQVCPSAHELKRDARRMIIEYSFDIPAFFTGKYIKEDEPRVEVNISQNPMEGERLVLVPLSSERDGFFTEKK